MFAIKAMRERKGLDQQAVADALGITKRRYGNWEREDREINLRDAIRLAQLFDCTLDELAGRGWPPSPALDADEAALVEAWRTANPQGRAAIEAVATSQAGMEGQPAAAPAGPPGISVA